MRPWGSNPRPPRSCVKHSTSELQKTQVLKDVTTVDVKSTESDAHSLVTLQVLV